MKSISCPTVGVALVRKSDALVLKSLVHSKFLAETSLVVIFVVVLEYNGKPEPLHGHRGRSLPDCLVLSLHLPAPLHQAISRMPKYTGYPH